MRRIKTSVELIAEITKALESKSPLDAVKDLMDRAYDLGYTRGRKAGINEIFTYKPEED